MLDAVRRRLFTLPTAVVAVFVVLGVCWAITSPPGTGVDEPSHYVRMIGLAEGRLFGDPIPLDTPFGTLTGEQLERVNREGGLYLLPGNLREPSACNVFDVELAYSCAPYPVTEERQVHPSYHARYLPGAYFLPAAFSTAGDTTWKALVAGRLGAVVQNALLLWVVAAAVARCVRRSGSLTTGAAMVSALSVTPVLVFLSGTLSPSSTEIFGVAAFTAAMVVAVRQRSTWWWWLAVLCGVMATWSRDLGGPAVVMGAIGVALIEPAFAERWRRRTRGDLSALATLVVSVVGAQVWQLLNKASLQPDLSSLTELWSNLVAVAAATTDSIGLVGWLVVPMDPVAEALWAAVMVVGLVMALQRLGRRARRVVAAVLVVYVVAGVVVSAGMQAGGFALQGRYLLPVVAVGLVLLVCASVDGHAGVESGRCRWAWVRTALVVAAIGHFATLVVWAQRNAIGLNGSAIDFDRAAWTPPLGWSTWLVLGGAACVALACLGLPSQWSDRRARPRDVVSTDT